MDINKNLPARLESVTGRPLPGTLHRTIEATAILRFVILMVVMVVAAGIRVWGLDQVGYNTDEAVYAGQAAAIAQIPILKELFPVFRAHPLLFQFILAVLFRFGVNDVAGRVVAALIGVATVYLVYRLGSLLHGENAGLLAALILAVMPYHVIVSRQVLLDGPLVFCSTLTLYLLARYAMTERPIWLYAVGVGMGLTFLAKETGIILVGAIYAFLALSGEIRLRLRDLFISFILMVMMILPYPLSLWLAGSSRTGEQYLLWQLFRRPNHTWDFYPTTVTPAIGILVIVVALLGFLLLRGQYTWKERLLVWWIIVPVVFFQIWPTKGFQYLLPIAPPFALLASRTLTFWSSRSDAAPPIGRRLPVWINMLVMAVMLLTLVLPSLQVLKPATTGSFLAGTGGVPGGREAGDWIRENLPLNSTLLTIGPSMANILQFYGYRRAYGLSVSPNPLHRNPAYLPVLNPDMQIRNGDIQYVVWDSYSAERSPFFSDAIFRYAKRYNGQIVHTESVTVQSPDGSTIEKPVIIIYEVIP